MQLGKSYDHVQNAIFKNVGHFWSKQSHKSYMTFTENYRPRAAAKPRGSGFLNLKNSAAAAAAAFYM